MVSRPKTKPVKLKQFCTCSLTRCRRVSFPWSNRSSHSRPTWKASEMPARMGLQRNSLTLQQSVPPNQRQAMRHRRARARLLHRHLFLPLTLRGPLSTFPPPSDNCINLEGRNDFHQVINGEAEDFQMLIICWYTYKYFFCHEAVFLQIPWHTIIRV